MSQQIEPRDGGGGVMAVPPELQQLFDDAVAGTARATTAGIADIALARDAFVAAWQAITTDEAFSSTSDVFRAYVSNMVGLALQLRNGAADVDAAIAAFQWAVATIPADSGSRPGYLGNLGFALVERLSRTETTADRDAAIAAFQGALAGTTADDPKRLRYLSNLAVGLHRRFGSDGVSADLDAAIRAFQQVLRSTPAGSPDRPRYLVNLGAGLQSRFDAGGASADLDGSIAAYQEAVEATPADDPNRSARLASLGLKLRARYDRDRASSDLDSAIGAFAEAIETTTADDRERADRLDNLGNGLLERYGQGGAPADLEAAIAAFTSAVEVSQADDPGRSGRLMNLGNSLHDRYTRTGARADLEAAITAHTEALRTGPSDGRDRALCLTNLGIGLLERHLLTGSQADLDAAIAAQEEAVEIGTDDPAGQSIRKNNLGAAVTARYSRTGSMADLEVVIAIFQDLVETTPADDPGRAIRLNNLGMGIRERHARTAAIEDLEAACALFQEALRTIPPGSPERPKIQANVGESLRVRYDAKAEPADLETCISVFQEVLAATPADAPLRPRYLEDIGGALLARYGRGGVPAVLEAAITALRESTEATPADSPFRVDRLSNLALGLIERHTRTHVVADLDAAVAAMREACRSGLTIAPAIVLGTAQGWGVWASARGAWAEAAEAYGHGLAAIDRLYESQLLPGAKQTWLGAAQGLAVAAAYALARIGAPAAAMLALERGRARVLTEAIQRDRAELADVELLDPAAYAAYGQAVAKVRALESQDRATRAGRPGSTSTSPPGVLQDLARQARADLKAAIARLQQLPGHARFGQLATVEEVAAAAEAGRPLVALVVNAAGSVALVVSRVDGAAAPTFEAIWAPQLTSAVLDEVLTTVEDGKVVGGYLAGQLGEPAWLESALADGLPKVGTSLIAPVAARLREMDATGVVLLPTGLLGLLPLHAAPYPVDGETRCLLDEFDVSHTPGALVLRAARATVAVRDTEPAVLVGVGNPQPHPEPLAFARAELEQVARFFPEGSSRPLYETAATETALVALLPQATHVHFACHGWFDAETPLDSCLELARPKASEPGGDEGRLRLEEILDNDWFIRTRLVVLSACQTAIIDTRRLPDEAIGLPAGLLQAGVPGVIGTLWSVDDLSTTLLMSRFYAYHREGDPSAGDGPLSPAAALRRAQVWLRTVTADDLVELIAADRSPAAVDQRRAFALVEPGSRPYAEPFYWAAFVAIGA